MTAGAEIGRILEDQDGFMHACEGETSLMMAVAPDLVDDDRLPEAFGPRVALLSDPSRVYEEAVTWRDVTPSGVAGDARRATAVKGEAIMDACTAAMARWISAWTG